MGATKKMYEMQLKSSNGYHSQLIMQDELDAYEPPFDCKVIGIVDVYQEPQSGDFYHHEVENESYTNAESSIINKW